MDRQEHIERIMEYKWVRRKVSRTRGDKKHGICPDCGHHTYDFHEGRIKSCTTCGLDNEMERKVDAVKWLIRHDMVGEITETSLFRAINYIHNRERFRRDIHG